MSAAYDWRLARDYRREPHDAATEAMARMPAERMLKRPRRNAIRQHQHAVPERDRARDRGDPAGQHQRLEVDPPERLFERRWALTVLDVVLTRLREDYAQRNQAAIFTALEHVLTAGAGEGYARIARQLGMTEAAVKVAAHRLRRRYRDVLREEIAQTVSDANLVEAEIRQLLTSL